MQSAAQNAYIGQEVYFKMQAVDPTSQSVLNEEKVMLNAMQAIGKIIFEEAL